MTNNTKMILAIILLLIVAGLVYLSLNNERPPIQSPNNPAHVGGDRDTHGCIGSAGYSWCEEKKTCQRSWEEYCTATPPKTVVFTCDDSKSITASFYIGDDKFVDLVLSDERKMSVPHAISGSGARYARADESFVFWNKGDTAFITEGASSSPTYTNCVVQN